MKVLEQQGIFTIALHGRGTEAKTRTGALLPVRRNRGNEPLYLIVDLEVGEPSVDKSNSPACNFTVSDKRSHYTS